MNDFLWNADLGDGTYKNPILYTDYSDPDVVRVGEDYFMVASSFTNTPAIPVLHSKDLVNWKVINYVLDKLSFPHFDDVIHGHGVWAPAIRHHDNKFWVCFPMPDEGLFFSTTEDPFGAWSEPFALREGKGWIDPCPFWDDDGKAYMVSAYAKSRTGLKSLINLAPMKPDGTSLLNDGEVVFDGSNTQPTIEGPKMYKQNGYYYILAPAGGVKHGWQTALRSKNIFGPYEEKIVMFRGDSNINGPHQGGLIDTVTGEWWFIHFQDVGTAGRITHLQPVTWIDDWPIIGRDTSDAIGVPVSVYRKPNVGKEYPRQSPADSDDFSEKKLGLQWQWNANQQDNFYTLDNALYLNAMPIPEFLCDAPNLLLQKFPAPEFQATTKIDTTLLKDNTNAGMIVQAKQYGAISIKKVKNTLVLSQIQGEIGESETEIELLHMEVSGIFSLKLVVNGDDCEFFYSVDEVNFVSLFSFTTSAGIWVGAKVGLFCLGEAGRLKAIDFMLDKIYN